MKEAKIITIISSSISLILIPFVIYFYSTSKFIYNILISIITGVIVTIITSLCQYFVIKGKIKNNIFNCYFDMYKAIYASQHKRLLFHYPVHNIYDNLLVFSTNLSKNLAEYSSFFPAKNSKLYKRLNPTLNPDFNEFNIKNLSKLFFPINSKRFNELIIPAQKALEKTLKEIDNKEFEKEFKEYKRLFYLLNK